MWLATTYLYNGDSTVATFEQGMTTQQWESLGFGHEEGENGRELWDRLRDRGRKMAGRSDTGGGSQGRGKGTILERRPTRKGLGKVMDNHRVIQTVSPSTTE